jgi:hypothetical protein
MFRQFLLTGIAMSVSAFAQSPSVVHDDEDTIQPGSIQFQGVTQADEIRLDGEVVNAKGLARSKYVLLLAPGNYVVSVRRAETGESCTARVAVRASETVTPICSAEPVRLARRN